MHNEEDDLRKTIMTEMSPIFVVGPSRSGTALMRSVLNNHPNVHLAGETHYFDDLRLRLSKESKNRVGEQDKHRCEDYFLSIADRPYGHGGRPDCSRICRKELAALANQLGGSGDAYFEAYCKLQAGTSGTMIWGEKTPRHVFRIQEILQAFPSAKIICMVRDPRAVVTSYRDWKNQGGFDFQSDPGHCKTLEQDKERAVRSYHPITISYLWKAAMTAGVAAQAIHGESRIRMVKFEDLVVSPEEVIRSITEYMGVDFDSQMLNVPMHNSSYSRFEEGHGLSMTPINRWRNKLQSNEVAVVEKVCMSLLREYGYDPIAPKCSTYAKAWLWCTFPPAVARAATANRSRIVNLPNYAWKRAKLAFGL